MKIAEITERQREQLLQVRTSGLGSMKYSPCQVTLKNGVTFDNVYVQEERNYFNHWGIMPSADPFKNYLLIEDVTEIRESPNRLPIDIANKIYEAGESGMGYCLFQLIMNDGTIIDCCTGNAVDFVALPPGLTHENIKDVLPHQGSRKNFIRSSKYYWCLFRDRPD